MHMVAFASAAAYAIIVRNHTTTPYDTLFDAHGRRLGVDSNLLRAIARTESGFRNVVSQPNANGSRDYGVMQINETNFGALGLTKQTALVENKNIEAAAKFLRMLKTELGERDSIFARISAYNIGSPRFLRDGAINETYVSSVYWHYTLYQMGRVFA